MKKIASLTMYERIYKKTYWGKFTIDNFENVEELVENRNDFANFHKITNFVSNESPKYPIVLFDHCELYKSFEGYVYVVSPYQKLDDLAKKLSMDKYEILYADNTFTYIKTFKNKVEFNRFIRNVPVIINNLSKKKLTN
ncbi:MAG: hypothetical protein PF574_06620 [Candidatus Delongbacteria bacterium]|nr:hypothetical protein [Candidatus Delongbacteria bacterium]